MKPRKRFGQHFLKDHHVLQQLCLVIAAKTKDHLVEIGPGRGALTHYLIGLSQQYDLIEIDRDLIPLLQARYGSQAIVHQGDALTFNFRQLVNQQPLRLVGNLPYNISTPLLFHLFDQSDIIQDMHFLLQQEIVDRLVAPVNSRNYGRLTVMAQYYCNASQLFTITAEAFSPPPKVTSAFVRLQPHSQPPMVNSLTTLRAVVNEAFSYRRKTLRNSLKALISSNQLIALDIDPKKRPQQLSLVEYIRISDAIRLE